MEPELDRLRRLILGADMALVKATLEQQLTAIFSNTKNTSEQCAKQIADAVDAYIKSATVTVTGTSATGGPVTGVGVIS